VYGRESNLLTALNFQLLVIKFPAVETDFKFAVVETDYGVALEKELNLLAKKLPRNNRSIMTRRQRNVTLRLEIW